ncbi:MAG: translation initiation factor IF-2 N-terminal domain-containing protein, partial [Longimicrobiaceae bacterium]
MRVFEVAKELSVPAEALVQLLREMDIPVRSHMSDISDEHVARVRTWLERERRLGHRDVGEAVEAAIGDAASAPRRRRRKKEDLPEGEPDAAEAPSAEADRTASPAADAADALAAEAAEAAADRGAELVTQGGREPTGVTVVVDTAELPAAPAAESAPTAESIAPAPAAAAPEPAVATPAAEAAAAEARPEPARPT